jgi:hypothetical protein
MIVDSTLPLAYEGEQGTRHADSGYAGENERRAPAAIGSPRTFRGHSTSVIPSGAKSSVPANSSTGMC